MQNGEIPWFLMARRYGNAPKYPFFVGNKQVRIDKAAVRGRRTLCLTIQWDSSPPMCWQWFWRTRYCMNGTYSVIFANDFPVVHHLLVVYLAITNGHGRSPIKVRLVDVDESREPIFEIESVIEFSDPLQVLETVFAARGVRFPEPGEYRLQVFGAGQFLRERRLQVIPAPGTEG